MLQRLIWRPQIRIEVFEPQHLRIIETIGEVSHILDADLRYVL